MRTELRVIEEGTAEFELPHACPTCGGGLELRISPGTARSFCGSCHIIGRPLLHHDGVKGFSLNFRDVGLA